VVVSRSIAREEAEGKKRRKDAMQAAFDKAHEDWKEQQRAELEQFKRDVKNGVFEE